jgi:hypothetical protein
LSFNQLRGAGDLDSEETPGDAIIVSSSTATMLTEVRLLIVCIIVDVKQSDFGYEFFSFA